MGVLDVRLQDLKAVEPRRQGRGDGGPGRVRMLREPPGCQGGVADGVPGQAKVRDHLPALGEGDGHGDHGLQVLEPDARIGHQLEVDGLEVLADDPQSRGRQQVMDVRNPARDGILHRDHSQTAITRPHGLKSLLEGCAGRGLHVGEGGLAGFVAVGPKLSLEGDPVGIHAGSPIRRA